MLSTAGTSKQQNSSFYTELTFEDNFNPAASPPPYDDVSSPTISTARPINTSSDKQNKDKDSRSEKLPMRSVRPKEPLVKTISQKPLMQPSPLMVYAIRLKHGEELRKALLAHIKSLDLKAAFIMTCVGSASSAKLRLANAAPNTESNYILDIVHPTEIVSLEGTISDGGHMHAALSDSTGKMLGGHLIELIVDTTAEVVIGECNAFKFQRTFDERTGFKELSISQR